MSERILHSKLTIYLLPLSAVLLTAIITCGAFLRTRQWNVPKSIALGIPLPLAASYFLWCTLVVKDFGGKLFMIRLATPQAFVLTFIGIWLAIAMMRGQEVTILSSLTIFLVALVGHLWTVMVVAGFSGYR